MLTSNIEAVIFDLDGTLVDSMWMWKSIDIEYLKRFNIEMPKDLQSEIEGMSFTETAHYFKNRFNIQDPIEKIKSDWNKMSEDMYRNDIKLKKGAKDFLDYLKNNSIKIGIATSNSKELTNICLESVGIKDYFNVIVTGCDVTKGKPHPEIYLKNAQFLDVLPENCLVFEDITVGITAAKSAGMLVCAVYDDYSKEQTLEKQEISDYYVEDFLEFMKCL